MSFDVNAPANSDSGIFGLPHSEADATVVVIPVPFEATVSYRQGTAQGPAAILAASHQVDLLDADVGSVWEAGIAMVAAPDWMEDLNFAARVASVQCIEALTRGEPVDHDLIDLVLRASTRVNTWVEERALGLLQQGRLPVVVGGDHSVPLGAIRACGRHLSDKPLGILHLDAHCDLRPAYEGFQYSHASIMKNVLDDLPHVKLVQIGIRDFSDGELAIVADNPHRITTYFDAQMRQARLGGGFASLAARIVENLPKDVYLSFDIDGLDPALCPSTGTPVPGGLSFDEIICILDALARSGRRVVGLDLVEVAPPADADAEGWGASWDANVAARLLYKMIGFALLTRGQGRRPELPIPPGI